MKEGIVPPRLLGGVAKTLGLATGDFGDDAKAKIEDGFGEGRGIEEGDATDGGEDTTVVPCLGVESIDGRPKWKGTASSTSSSSS